MPAARTQAAHSQTSLVSRNVKIGEHRTSVRLEPLFWDTLFAIARSERRTTHQICTEVAADGHSGGFTSGLRIFILKYVLARSNAVQPPLPHPTPRPVDRGAVRSLRLRQA